MGLRCGSCVGALGSRASAGGALQGRREASGGCDEARHRRKGSVELGPGLLSSGTSDLQAEGLRVLDPDSAATLAEANGPSCRSQARRRRERRGSWTETGGYVGAGKAARL
ncbi:hypothetical protein ACJRO7_036025 [Eucalyptus globulus]|uniref:Uncharacterized protein n=1 Tax=Eucalyptus globulus TaxID=34317 RepID=A0ABD3J7W4_EUCGL